MERLGQRMCEEEEMRERLNSLQRQREAEERDKCLRERLAREAEQRRREPERQQGGGRGCIGM